MVSDASFNEKKMKCSFICFRHCFMSITIGYFENSLYVFIKLLIIMIRMCQIAFESKKYK